MKAVEQLKVGFITCRILQMGVQVANGRLICLFGLWVWETAGYRLPFFMPYSVHCTYPRVHCPITHTLYKFLTDIVRYVSVIQPIKCTLYVTLSDIVRLT